MKFFSKSILTTLLLTLAFNSSFGQDSTYTIELSLNPGDSLNDPGERMVYRGDTVLWIKTGENFRSFNIMGTRHPFRTKLPKPRNNFKWIKRDIKHSASDGSWKYLIKYKTENHRRPRYLDPKITVMPSPLIED
jgi:hypothetical protein